MAKPILLGIDLSGDWAKLAIVEQPRSARPRIMLTAVQLAGRPDAAVQEGILQRLKALQVTPTHLTSAIPRESVTLKHLRLPSVHPKELKEMVNLQAPRQVPYPREELVVDFQSLHQDTEGYSTVLAVIAHRDIVNRHLTVLDAFPGELKKLVMSSHALTGWLHNATAGSSPDETGPLACLDLDGPSGELVIADRERLLFSRAFPVPGGLSAATEMPILDEVRATVAAYEKENLGPRPARLVVVGASPIPGAWSSALGMRVEVASDVGVFSNVERDPAVPESVSFAAALGLVTRSHLIPVNLMPGERQADHMRSQRRQELARLAIVSVALVGAGLGVAWTHVAGLTHEIAQIDQELTKLKAPSSATEALLNGAKHARTILTEPGPDDLVKELAKILPPGMALTSLSVIRKECNLKGVSPGVAEVSSALAALEQSPLFHHAKIRYATTQRRQDRELTEFELTCEVTGPSRHDLPIR